MPDAPGQGAPDTGTPPGGQPPGVAAGSSAPGGPPNPSQGGPSDSPGVLPPQGAGVPMSIKAAGDHAVGMDIMRAILKGLREAVRRLGDSKEGNVAAEMLVKAGHMFAHAEGGKEDSVDPMQRVQQAIQARRVQQQGPQQGAPPMGAGAPMPNRGPVPMGAGGPG
jgi:hypothetical protein